MSWKRFILAVVPGERGDGLGRRKEVAPRALTLVQVALLSPRDYGKREKDTLEPPPQIRRLPPLEREGEAGCNLEAQLEASAFATTLARGCLHRFFFFREDLFQCNFS